MTFSQLSSKIEKFYLLAQKEILKKLESEGQSIIDLSIVEPDVVPPYQLNESLERVLRDHKNNTYPSALGILELREKIADWEQKEYGIPVDSTNIIMSSGARGGIISLLQALINPGDEVILPAPYWSGYPNQIKLIGGIPKIVLLDEENSFIPEINALEKATNSRTKVIILNNPHNPTGMVWDKDTLHDILKWAEKKNIFVIADEVCSIGTFDDKPFIPMAKVRGSFKNLAVVRSFSKNLAIPGWRVGWVTTAPELINKLDAIQAATIGGICSIVQHALVDSWDDLLIWLDQSVNIHKERRDVLYEGLSKQHGFRTIRPQSGNCTFTNIRYYLGNEVGGEVPRTSEEFVDIVLRKTGVLLSSGQSLGMDGFVRFCFTKDTHTLNSAVQKISNILER